VISANLDIIRSPNVLNVVATKRDPLVTHVITKLEYATVRENIRAPSVLGVLRTIMDRTAILVIATRGEGNLQPVMPVMANVIAKRVLTLEMEENASIVCLGIMDQLAKIVIVTPAEGSKNPVNLTENVSAKKDSMEKNVIR